MPLVGVSSLLILSTFLTLTDMRIALVFATLSTNVPTARLSPVFQVVSCSASNYARMDVDYFSARATGVSR